MEEIEMIVVFGVYSFALLSVYILKKRLS